MKDPQLQPDIDALREFNRLYTSRLGLLNERLDGSPFALTEARVIYELARSVDATAAQIARTLSLDKAQLSRILKRFTEQGLLKSVASSHHAKHHLLSLTAKGRAAFKDLDAGTNDAVGSLIQAFSKADRQRLLRAAEEMRSVLDCGTEPRSAAKRSAPATNLDEVSARLKTPR